MQNFFEEEESDKIKIDILDAPSLCNQDGNH